MGRLILLAILLMPFIEIAVFIWVGGQIGILATLAAIVGTAAAGIALLRMQGIGLILDCQQMMARGEVPARQFGEAMLLALAGVLLLIPGFVTDAIGFILFIPAVRAAIFTALSRNMVVVTTYRPANYPGTDGPKSIDLDHDSYR
ncbi:FxsA family protein [Pelagibacterium halotolerans]|uniref:FxsA family protein n=1 Tax=Pelagibacterium halotolerans TaxID=531813 RepID=UPI00384FCE61